MQRTLISMIEKSHDEDRIKAIHAQIANRRQDFLHKLSTRLVKEYGVIFVGNVKALQTDQDNAATLIKLRTVLADLPDYEHSIRRSESTVCSAA